MCSKWIDRWCLWPMNHETPDLKERVYHTLMLFLSCVSWEGWVRLSVSKLNAKSSIGLIYPPYIIQGKSSVWLMKGLIGPNGEILVDCIWVCFLMLELIIRLQRDYFIVCCWRNSISSAVQLKVFEWDDVIPICEHS